MEDELGQLKVANAALEKELARLRIGVIATSKHASGAELVIKKLAHHTLEAAKRAEDATDKAVMASARAAALAKDVLEKSMLGFSFMAARAAIGAAAAAVEAAAVVTEAAHAVAFISSHEGEEPAERAAMEAAASMEKRATAAASSAASAVKMAEDVAEQVRLASST